MHNTYLSIIIPCYNVEDYLPATIQSLRALENAEDCEFIFINDGSTDNTLKIILNFAEQDQRVVVIDQINSGVSAARNAALEIVQGKYFLPLDGDDKLRPNAVSIIRKSTYVEVYTYNTCYYGVCFCSFFLFRGRSSRGNVSK